MIFRAHKRVNPTGLTRRGSPCFETEVPKHEIDLSGRFWLIKRNRTRLADPNQIPVDKAADKRVNRIVIQAATRSSRSELAGTSAEPAAVGAVSAFGSGKSSREPSTTAPSAK